MGHLSTTIDTNVLKKVVAVRPIPPIVDSVNVACSTPTDDIAFLFLTRTCDTQMIWDHGDLIGQ